MSFLPPIFHMVNLFTNTRTKIDIFRYLPHSLNDQNMIKSKHHENSTRFGSVAIALVLRCARSLYITFGASDSDCPNVGDSELSP